MKGKVRSKSYLNGGWYILSSDDSNFQHFFGLRTRNQSRMDCSVLFVITTQAHRLFNSLCSALQVQNAY